MTTSLNIIDSWLSKTKDSLIQNYLAMGLKASGNLAEKLETKSEETEYGYRATILGEQYTGALLNGRKKNKNQENIKGFAGWMANKRDGLIYKWCQNKGFATKYAYPIALKIATEGINVPNQYNTGKLISAVITDELISNLIKLVGNAELENFFSGLKQELK